MNLTREKKIVAGVVSVALLAGCAFGVYKLSTKNNFSKDKLTGLVKGVDYKVVSSKIKDGTLDCVISGKLNEGQIKELSVNLDKKAEKEKWKEKKIEVDIIEKDVKNDDNKFYVDGLKNRIEIDTDKNIAEVGTFVVGDGDIKMAETLPEIVKDKVEGKDGNVKVYFDMKATDNAEETIGQAKMFSSLFKNANKGKDIKDLELVINDNKENEYEYDNEFPNVIESIKNEKL